MTKHFTASLVAGMALAVAITGLPATSARAMDNHAFEVGITYDSPKPMLSVARARAASVRTAVTAEQLAQKQPAAGKRRYLAREGNTITR